MLDESRQHVVKTTSQWKDRIVEYWVVPRGCLCVELTYDHKTRIKIGEGDKFYSQLPYVNDVTDLSDYYTKEEIDSLINNINLMAIRSTEEYNTKDDLPLIDNKLGDVLFVKSEYPEIKTDPDIYLWNGSKWIFVGYELESIDLSQYLKKDEFHVLFDPVEYKVGVMFEIKHTHENKSILDDMEEPFTTEEKDKLESLHNYDDTELRELINETAHTHSNKQILDTITESSLWSESDRSKFNTLHNYDDIINSIELNIVDLQNVSHTHANKQILDLTTASFTIQDKSKLDSLHNNEVFIGTDGMYSGRDGLVPGPGVDDAGKFLCSDGKWKEVESGGGGGGQTYYDFVGATAISNGTHGLVPAPAAGEQSYYLRGDGTWAVVSSSYVLPVATDSTLGGIKVGNTLSIDSGGVLNVIKDVPISYNAGEGISIDVSFDSSKITHQEYYFDTQVQCKISHTIPSITRVFTKVNTTPALGAVIGVWINSISSNNPLYGPFFVSTIPEGVEYVSDVNTNVFHAVSTPFEYKGYTWYYVNIDEYSAGGFYMENANTAHDAFGNMTNINTVFPNGTSLVTIAKAIIDAADITQCSKVISAKIGSGLSFDNNDNIVVDEMVGATSLIDGSSGTVPQPLIADKDKYLKGDGTWSNPTAYTAGNGVSITSGTASIPNEYCQLEYIEATGTQGIELNYIPDDLCIRYELSFSKPTYDSTGWHYFIGGWSGPSSDLRPPSIAYQFQESLNKAIVPCGVGNVITNGDITFDTTNVHTYKLEVISGAVTLQLDNGSIYSGTCSGNLSQKVGLFCSPSYGSNPSDIFETGKFRFHELIISESNNSSDIPPIHHYYPCYRKSDGVAGIYDVITDTFLTNVGTGNFLTGPEIEVSKINVIPATTNTIGGIIVGNGLVIDANGVLSIDPNVLS